MAFSSSIPNKAAITRLVSAILLEQNDEWAVQRTRDMTSTDRASPEAVSGQKRHHELGHDLTRVPLMPEPYPAGWLGVVHDKALQRRLFQHVYP
jgi:hypothetical protein